MIIQVFRFTVNLGFITWYGNLTHPYPITYVYKSEEIDQEL
jgi:hypothetical protein